jgi:hypothetical protein
VNASWARGLLVAALVAWLFSPPQWRYAIPLWLPFVVALALELQFFVAGMRGAARLPATRGRAPQALDVEEFGWGHDEPEDDDPAFWSSGPVPVQRKTALRRLVGPLLVAVVLVLVAWGVTVRRGWSSLDHATQARVERVLSRQAAAIAGHRVTVRCDSGRYVGAVQDSDGLAEVGGTRAWLAAGICYRLYRVIEKHDSQAFDPVGRAIAVLAHESWHLRGTRDEGVTNCYAFQSGVGIGMRLGLTHGRAEALMREQLANNTYDSADDSRYLVPAGCRNGGRYDLKPSSAQFP